MFSVLPFSRAESPGSTWKLNVLRVCSSLQAYDITDIKPELLNQEHREMSMKYLFSNPLCHPKVQLLKEFIILVQIKQLYFTKILLKIMKKKISQVTHFSYI